MCYTSGVLWRGGCFGWVPTAGQLGRACGLPAWAAGKFVCFASQILPFGPPRVGAGENHAPVYKYDAFGNERKSVDTDPNPFRYCGEYYDLSSGEYYLRARTYDPRTGRFATEDPARSGNNWYGYCGDNPITNVDPSGKDYFTYQESNAYVSSLYSTYGKTMSKIDSYVISKTGYGLYNWVQRGAAKWQLQSYFAATYNQYEADRTRIEDNIKKENQYDYNNTTGKQLDSTFGDIACLAVSILVTAQFYGNNISMAQLVHKKIANKSGSIRDFEPVNRMYKISGAQYFGAEEDLLSTLYEEKERACRAGAERKI